MLKKEIAFFKEVFQEAINCEIWGLGVRELKELREDYMIADVMKKIQLIQDFERAKIDSQYATHTFLINQEQRNKLEKQTIVELKEELLSLKRLVLSYLKRQQEMEEQSPKQTEMLINAYLQYGNLTKREKEVFLSYKPYKKQKVFV